METKKVNIFMELIYSLFNFTYYRKLLHNNTGKVFLHMLILVLFTVLLTIIVPIIQFQFILSAVGGFSGLIESMPYFEISNNKIYCEKEFNIDSKPIYVEINTDTSFSDNDAIYYSSKGYDTIILIDSNKFVVYENDSFEYFNLSDVNGLLSFNRDMLKNLIPFIYLIIAFMVFFSIIGGLIGYLFNALIVTLIGLIIASVMNKHYQFGSIYKLSIYTLTLPILISAVLPLIKVIIPFYWIIEISIACIYLGLAFKQIDSNININTNATNAFNNVNQINIIENDKNITDNSTIKHEDTTKRIPTILDENDPNNDINS